MVGGGRVEVAIAAAVDGAATVEEVVRVAATRGSAAQEAAQEAAAGAGCARGSARSKETSVVLWEGVSVASARSMATAAPMLTWGMAESHAA